MKKFLFFVILVLLLLAGAVVFFVLRNLDGVVKSVMETTGTEMLGEPVRVDGVSIKLASGTGELTGLTLANPEGYTDPHAFSMDRIRLGLNLGSLAGSPKRMTEFIIEAPEVYLEIREDHTSNLEELITHLKRKLDASPKPAEEPDTEPDTESEADAAATLLAIDHLKIAGVQLTVRHPDLKDGVKQLTLPDIELTDVGGTEGVTGARIGLVILESISKEAAKQALRREAEQQAERLLRNVLENRREEKEAAE